MSYVDLIFNRAQGLDGILRIDSASPTSPSAHIAIAKQMGNGPKDAPNRPPLDVDGRYVYLGFMTENPSATNGFRPAGRWVAVKVAIGQLDVASFRREAALYQGPLAALQGDVVPVLYGAWDAPAGKGGNGYACIALEWCSGDMTLKYKSSDELYQDLMVAVCKLHHAGVAQTKLIHDGGRDLAFSEDNSVRIIDFSLASVHECPGLSVCWSPDGRRKYSTCCPELLEVGQCSANIRRYFNMIQKVASKDKLRSTQTPVLVQNTVVLPVGGEQNTEWD